MDFWSYIGVHLAYFLITYTLIKMSKVEFLHKEEQQYSVLDPNLQIMWDALNLKLPNCLNPFSDENIFN